MINFCSTMSESQKDELLLLGYQAIQTINNFCLLFNKKYLRTVYFALIRVFSEQIGTFYNALGHNHMATMFLLS